MKDNNPIKDFIRDYKRYTSTLAMRISQRALLEMKSNFARQGYDSESGFRRWPKRRGERSLVAWKKRKDPNNRALLIKSGRLRRSLRAAPLYQIARVVTDVPYAEALHTGFKGTVSQTVKAHTRKKMGKLGIIKTNSKKKSTAIKFGKAQVGQTKVKSFNRTMKMNLRARPFLTVGPKFLEQEELRLLESLEAIFLRS